MKIIKLIAIYSLILLFSCQNEEYQDCHGTVSGGAYFDECGDCVGGRTGLFECTTDCNDDLGGLAYINPCDVCVNGGTEIPTDSCSSFEYNGQTYGAIIIGEQVWMTSDLISELYNNGDTIPEYQGDNTIGTLSKYIPNEENEEITIFYSWKIALSDKIAPQGWRVPNKSDYEKLISTLGGSNLAGGKLKESGYANWKFPNNFATNESGFSALGEGYRNELDIVQDIGNKCFFWSSDTIRSSNTASLYLFALKLSFDSNFAELNPESTTNGHLIRLIKDN